MCRRWGMPPGTRFASRAIFFWLLFVTLAHAQTSFYVGVCVHLGNNPGMSLIAQSGANSLRTDVNWAHVEMKKDQLSVPSGLDDLVNQALEANVQPLLILDYGNPLYDSGAKTVSPQALSGFARYAAFIVQHFKGRVHIYEMWNEWNLTAGSTRNGTPEEYVRFLRVVYPAVKAVDPSAVFLAGAIGGLRLDWLSAMLSAGAIGSFDALSIHPYNFSKSARTGDAWAEDMLATESVIHRYTEGRDISLYITEMGWPTYSGANGISPEEAAAYLGQMFLLSRTMNFIKGIWWYDFRDDGWDKTNKENSFGLVGPDLKPKPAFAALEAVSPIVRNAKGVEDLPTGSPSLRALRFRLNGDNQVLALWNRNQAGVIRVHVMGSVLLQIRSVDKDSDAYSVGANSKEETIEISGAPVLVTGVALDFKIIK